MKGSLGATVRRITSAVTPVLREQAPAAGRHD
jgi:hypothetical protein